MSTSVSVLAEGSGQQVAALRQEVYRLEAQLRRTQRLAAVGTLTAMIVHEFNNIFTTAIGRAQLAQNGDEASREKAIRCALEAYTRASTICRALLDFTSPDVDPPDTVHVGRLVDETLAAMARDPAKDGISLIKKIPCDLCVRTRPVELKQVLLNLLLNARAAVLAKGRGESIAISAARRNGEALLRVADTGVGIPPEHRKRIFEPFFTTRDGDGSGLGLPVCRQIVESLKGRISVRSQLGKGSCFTVVLPGASSSRRKSQTVQ